MRSMTIRHHKRQARLRAASNGTTHQAELNAIARENGHASWGGFQAVLSGAGFDKSELVHREADDRLLELVDAFDAARGAGGHLVVLRPTREEEASAILTLRNAIVDDRHRERLEGIAFSEEITAEALAGAASRGQTLVAASGGMARTTTRGHFIVHRPQDVLTMGGSLVSRRDQETIMATTMLRHGLPGATHEGVDDRTTTIVRTTASHRAIPRDAVFDSVDDGMAIRLDWNLSEDRRDEEWRRLGFVPSFNVLGPKFLPAPGEARDDHVERIADILLPGGDPSRSGRAGRRYFEEKAHDLLVGLIHLEICRAERQARTPSIPAMMDWLRDGMYASAEAGSPQASSLEESAGWFRDVVVECMDQGHHERCATELIPLVSMAPNERIGILGTVDQGLLPFKNARVRRMNS